MKIFVFGELNEARIQLLCPASSVVEKLILKDYAVVSTAEGRAFLQMRVGASVTGFVVDCTPEDLWSLDQWKNVLLLHRKPVLDGVEAHFPLYSLNDSGSYPLASEEELVAFAARRSQGRSLRLADLHLLIPGAFPGSTPKDAERSFLGRRLQDMIHKTTLSEFNSEFLTDTQRFALGNIEILFDDGSLQSAILTLMYHNKTQLCVADIFVPAVTASTHEILCGYCGNFLTLRYQGHVMSVTELCDAIGIRPYGTRRSMVFCYEKISEELLLNVLVNEETPMGKIMGSHFKELIANNVAQYDTAEVYVSEATMIEISDRPENDLMTRIASQAIEIFFVEMLLLQDASVSKMYDSVQREIAIERETPFRENASQIISTLVDESAYALNFTDYQQFYFPTVRVSAWKIAKAFGIDSIREKYDRSKDILEDMIEKHNAEISKNEEKFENQLLLVLAILSGVEPLHIGLNLWLNHDGWAYALSIVLLCGLWLCFFGLRKYKRRKMQKNKKVPSLRQDKKRKEKNVDV